MAEFEDLFQDLVNKFHEKIKAEADFKSKFEGEEITAEMDIQGDDKYHFHLKDCGIVDYGVGPYDDKDVYVTMTLETFEKLQSNELNPMKAFMQKKITFKGSMKHLLLMKSVLMGE